MSSSEIEDIKISDDYSDLIVIGYRAEEIATNIKAKKFIERNDIFMQDVLEYSRKIVEPYKFLPKPLYISPGQSLFSKYNVMSFLKIRAYSLCSVSIISFITLLTLLEISIAGYIPN